MQTSSESVLLSSKLLIFERHDALQQARTLENELKAFRKLPLPGGHTRALLALLAYPHREVLDGVGADGVGVKFPIFPVNCSCVLFVLENKEKNEEKRRKTKKKGKFPPTPSTLPTPLRTFQPHSIFSPYISLLSVSLLISEEFWRFLISPAITVFSAHLPEGIKTPRSQRN